jgi:hypothetical protein
VFISIDCVLMNVANRNFSDVDTKGLTGSITHGISAVVLQKIILTVSVIRTHHTLCNVPFLFLQT